jgi:hypothetical protein
MAHTGQWKVDVFLFEDNAEVTAEACSMPTRPGRSSVAGRTRLDRNATAPEIGRSSRRRGRCPHSGTAFSS